MSAKSGREIALKYQQQTTVPLRQKDSRDAYGRSINSLLLVSEPELKKFTLASHRPVTRTG